VSSAAPAPPEVSATRLIAVLGGIAAIAGLLVVTTYEATFARIADNKRRAIERAVFQVIPGAVTRRDFVVSLQGIAPASVGGANTGEGITVYAGYDANNKLLGIAAEAAAQGYQDTIRILYGYAPACECITGIRVLKMAETPGLGDKIARDPAFLQNFRALDASLNDTKQALRNAIVTVKHGSKTEPWQIDAISGATISSKAVGKMLNESAATLLPRLWPHRKVLHE
jgi:electron transport complex protein RnfG